MAAAVVFALGLLFCRTHSQLCSPGIFPGSLCEPGRFGSGLNLGQFAQPCGSCGIQAPPCGIQAPACGVQTPACGVQTPACGIQTPACGIQTPACGIQSPGCGIQTPACGIQTPGYSIQPPTCGIQTPSCNVQTTPCCVQAPQCVIESPPCGIQAPPCGIQMPPCGIQMPPCGIQVTPCGIQAPPCGLQVPPFGCGLQAPIINALPSFVQNQPCPSYGTTLPPLISPPCANPVSSTMIDNTLANTLANAIQLLILSNLLENTQSPCSNLLSPGEIYSTPCNNAYEIIAPDYYPCNQIVSCDIPCEVVAPCYQDSITYTSPCVDSCSSYGFDYDCGLVNPYSNGFSCFDNGLNAFCNPMEAIFSPVAAEVAFPAEIPAQLVCNFGYTLPNNVPCVSVNVEALPFDSCGTCSCTKGVFF